MTWITFARILWVVLAVGGIAAMFWLRWELKHSEHVDEQTVREWEHIEQQERALRAMRRLDRQQQREQRKREARARDE